MATDGIKSTSPGGGRGAAAKDPITHVLLDAQKLAFAPLMFQAARALLKLKVLDVLHEAGEAGLVEREIAERLNIPEYGIRVLAQAGTAMGLVRQEQGRFVLTKLGYVWLTDEIVHVNADFVHDVCYRAFYWLDESVRTGRPEGLKVFAGGERLYPGLTALPEPARSSWYRFDHYYSDDALPKALAIAYKNPPQRVLDIGGNTGRFAVACAEQFPDARLTIIDLPRQLRHTGLHIRSRGYDSRITCLAMDVLDESAILPGGHDSIWMSQFLDCFSGPQNVGLLHRVRDVMTPDTTLFVMEPCWDRQRFEASTYSLHATSLYFACIANGNSQMYSAAEYLTMIEEAGLAVEEQHDHVGICQTLFKCRRR